MAKGETENGGDDEEVEDEELGGGFGEAGDVEEVGEAEDENTKDELVRPDENGVGEEGKEEGEEEELVGAGGFMGIDENEEDTEIFYQAGDGRVGAN